MENEKKVFSSTIIRRNTSKNNLRDMLNIVPVQPLPLENTATVPKTTNHNFNFVPKCDKSYVPKKKHSRKVKTVRDIRNAFVKDVYCNLPIELEKQRNTLLRKIRYGSSRDDRTKEIANNMLKSDNPLSKSTWQMLMNINPEGHKFSSQYVLWKGKCIRVNGSKGGQNKFICKLEVDKINQACYNQSVAKSTVLTSKRRLLHQSLNIKFKPGPLSKKKDLDTSYQKYNFGEIALVNLPKPGLEVQSSYGKSLAPVIDTFLHKSFFDSDNGLISSKWAKFAVSVLGRANNGFISQISEDSCVTFDLNYNCSQRRLLMRHDGERIDHIKLNANTKTCPLQENESVMSVIKDIINKVIDTIELSLKQDELYSGEDEHREMSIDNSTNTNSQSNNKTKRKLGELSRLDVTVIRISDKLEPKKNTNCQNDYCSLGCVCDSLECTYNLKRHCGQIECMFKCKCDFSKYKYKHSFDNYKCSDIIPGLINLDERLGQTLAKEEHKFHQTVIVTDERSILLKSDRRNWKTSKKYADFYSNMRLKTDHNTHKMLSIVCPNLNLKNVEPWCMVHNLYKCFCKGRFTEPGPLDFDDINTIENSKTILKVNRVTSDSFKTNEKCFDTDLENITNQQTNEIKTQGNLTQVQHVEQYEKYNNKELIYDGDGLSEASCIDSHNILCARAQPYNGRKYYEKFYYNTNKKIMEMEKNDKTLHKKMLSLVTNEENPDNNIELLNSNDIPSSSLKELLCSVIEHSAYEADFEERGKRLPIKNKLVVWLEKNYKQYKQRVSQGVDKVTLDPPKAGKLCLYSWNFILSRYRERKNYFLISKQKPFRIYVAVDMRNSFLESCTNISDINLSEIDNYPITVKNLLTNACDLKENFCILCGLLHCWELIGSVTKVNENQNEVQNENTIYKTSNCEEKYSQLQNSVSYDIESLSMSFEDCTDKIEKSFTEQVAQISSDVDYNLDSLPINVEDNKKIIKKDFTSECLSKQKQTNELPKIPISKWFVMKVENDFSEIQFYKKGFFVKYESVVKAINVAKVSCKTVRLSSQKCSNDQSDPQFGIYAIPSNEEQCVFIGPYEKDDNLGIEAIKKVQTVNNRVTSQTRTRGIWILTNKVDNLKVIDNPLLFISSSCLHDDKMVILESDSINNYNSKIPEISCTIQNDKVTPPKSNKDTVVKQVKPIKILKTNGFYHLTTKGYIKSIQSPQKDMGNKAILLNTKVPIPVVSKRIFNEGGKTIANPKRELSLLINAYKAEDSCKIKKQNEKTERGMFVLKPEEINKRSLEKRLPCELQPIRHTQTVVSDSKNQMTMDIENFLTTSANCSSLKDVVYVISDDEKEESPVLFTKGETIPETIKNVWIVCKNVENLGWILGKRNSKNYLSFEFPGFKSSDFYPECEAFKKISNVFARKVYVPKHIELEWHVAESEAEVKTINKLEEKFLCSDYILTKRGFRHKYEVMKKLVSLCNAESSPSNKDNTDQEDMFLDEKLIEEKWKIMSDLEEASKTLEDESSFLWDKTMSNQGQILQTFSLASEELRKELTMQLNSIKSDAET